MVTKKSKSKKNKGKQFTIKHTIGQDSKVHSADGDNYMLLALDIKSPMTGETVSFPVIMLENIDGPTHIIPMTSVGDLIYNWGFKEEMDGFRAELDKIVKDKKLSESKHPEKEKDHGMFN